MTDAQILTPDAFQLMAASAYHSGTLIAHDEALRAQLAAIEADRADVIARRDQALDDLRQRWEAEIAARKLVEAKLAVAEAKEPTP